MLQNFHTDTLSFFVNNPVLVTGGTGFIGTRLVEFLVKMGASVKVISRQANPPALSHLMDRISVIRCNLQDLGEARRAIRGTDTVLSLAATVAGLDYNAKHPGTIFRENLQTFLTTIQAAQEAGVRRFLTTSSACVYPRDCSVPTPESEGFVDSPEKTNAGYGWSKRMEEFVSTAYAQEFGMKIAIARPYNGYGPGDNFEPSRSHVIPSLIRKAFETQDGTFQVWGSGEHSRSFLYLDDFARGLLEVAARYPEADPVNLGSREETTIKTLAWLIADLVSEYRGTQVSPVFQPEGLTGQPRRTCDTSKAEEILGFRASIPLAEGLRKTVEWYARQTLSRTSKRISSVLTSRDSAL
jgi:GDP-L-fucose synthase